MFSSIIGSKSLAMVTYSSITRNGETVLVNRAFGSLIDDLAQSFRKIYYIGADAPTESSVYNNGKSIYSYSIMSKNVVIIPLQPTAYIGAPSARIRRMASNQVTINKVLNDSDYAYIFLPSYTGLVAAFGCIVRKKPYFLYFGSNWNETGSFRLPDSGGNAILFRAGLKLYSFAEKSVVKRALFGLATGKRLLETQCVLNSRIFETVPMLQFVPTEISKQNAQRSICDITIKILSVGNVKESKGSSYLLKALPYLLSKGFDVEVVLVGAIDETYQSMLLEEITKRGINDRVHFVGYVSDVELLQDYYKKTDVFVLPTLGEGFPRVLYEAMVFGLPIVASAIDSIRTNLRESEGVSLVPPKDPQAIASAVEELIRNEKLRKKQIEAGYRFVAQKFNTTPGNQIVSLLEKYGDVHGNFQRP